MTKEELIKIFKRPLYLSDNISITVERIYTDVNGTVVDKAAVVAAMPALECNTPVYLFGEYDRKGGYLLAQKFFPAPDAIKFLNTYVYGVNTPFFFGANALTDIQKKCKPGDIINVYTDNLLAPTYYIWLRFSCSTTSIASFVENMPMVPKELENAPLYTSRLKFYSTIPLQWNEEVQCLWADYKGLVNHNYVDPITFRGPFNYDNGFVQINLNTVLSQYVGFNTYMLFDTDSITYNFNLLMKNKSI